MDDNSKIQGSDSIQDVLTKMCQGNIGALNVLINIVQTGMPEAFIVLLDLDDMGMRGSSIWIGFKDWAGEDMEKFIQATKDRNPKMVEMVNKVPGCRAQVRGASFA